MNTNTPLVETRDLKKYFNTPKGILHAVDEVNLKVWHGETLGIVGESGCGKSTLGRTILRLLTASSGEILYNGKDISKYTKKQMKPIRAQMQMIFQDPFSSLNARLSVGNIIAEPIKVCGAIKGRQGISQKVKELMDICGLPERYLNLYPHELDGGRRQRIGLARALAVDPQFIVCDEPVSALDVSIQAQILNLLMDLQVDKQISYLFITHDLCVVRHISKNIMVMYMGKVVEYASGKELFSHPLHPYTQALLSSIPIINISEQKQTFKILKGEVANPIEPKPGCRFAPRCHMAKDICKELVSLKEYSPNHFVACTQVN